MNFFKQLRISRRLSQEEVAGAIGLSQGFVSKLERGMPVEKANLEKICEYYGISLDAVPNVRLRERNLR